jgi:hypothetical protein
MSIPGVPERLVGGKKQSFSRMLAAKEIAMKYLLLIYTDEKDLD